MIVVVGGGPAGHAAAAAYRSAGGEDEVVLITDDDRPPYNRPPLTKELLRGESGEDDLPLDDLDRVDIVYGTAVRLDPDARVVELEDGRRFVYRACVLATGAEPLRRPGTFSVRHVRDALALREAAPERVTVVGTGFIGCEVAASLAMTGARVTVVGQEDIPQEARLGRAAGERIAGFLRDLGVELRLGEAVEDFDALDGTVVLALGVTPRVELARDAGLRLSEDGRAIAVDVALRTTADDVYACGDVAMAQHPVAGRPLRVEHWGDALKQGESVGRRLAGDDSVVWDVVPGFWSTIGEHTLKYAAWGDGFARDELVEHPGGAWTAWYYDADDALVGALCHERDEDYERAQQELGA